MLVANILLMIDNDDNYDDDDDDGKDDDKDDDYPKGPDICLCCVDVVIERLGGHPSRYGMISMFSYIYLYHHHLMMMIIIVAIIIFFMIKT